MTRSNDAYVYTGLANLDRDYAANGLNQYTAVGVSPLTYDSNGNLVADGANTYGYDAENRLISTSFGVSMGYDPLGRLFQLGTPGGTRQMLYDGDQLVGEYDQATGASLAAYVHGPAEDDPLAWYDGAGFVRLLHTDHQGSIIGMAGGPEGQLAATNAYDEYGTPRSGNTGRFQYTGQAWLAELGMYYYKARIYSPKLGRFLQTDPIGTTDQINLYAYVANDPVDGRDPTGLACLGTLLNCDGGIAPGRSGSSTESPTGNGSFQNRLTAAGAALGAVIGGITGGTAGGAAGTVAGTACGPAAAVCSPVAATAGATEGAALGATGGALVGATVGSLIGTVIDKGSVLFNKAKGDREGGGDRQTNGRPGANTAQNQQVKDASRQEGLSAEQRRVLGREVEKASRQGGENLGYRDIREIARAIKSGNY